MSKFDKDTTMEDVMEDPAKYGMPSFMDFSRMRNKYVSSEESAFEQVDKGSNIFKKGLKKFRFEIAGFRCHTLEEVERVAREQGIPVRELDYQPEMIPLGGGEAEILVKFVSKDERKRREENHE